MNNEGLNCVDMEQSDGGDDVELNEAAAPSLNPSVMSDTSGGSSAAKLPPGSRLNSKSKISEKVNNILIICLLDNEHASNATPSQFLPQYR